MGAKINCSICGKPADSEMENCPHCGSPIKVGRPVVPVTPAPSSAESQQACPKCGAAVQDGDIVCGQCGVNLLTGHQVVRDSAEPSAAPARSNTPYILIGLLAAGLVIVAGVALFMVLRDPVTEARQMARSGNMLEAIELMQKHTDKHPEDSGAFGLLGRLYMQTQQYPNAASAFDTAARLRPSSEELNFLSVLAAGKIEGETGQQRVIAALERMVEHHPDNERAVRMLALAQGASGNTGAALGALDDLAGLGAPPREVKKYEGIVDALAGDYEAAQTALEASGAADQDARLAQGYVASLDGKKFAAADILSAAVSGSQNVDREARTRLGLLHMAQGNFDEALPLLRPDTAGWPSPSARFFYALCLQTAGLKDEALLEYERLVSAEGPFAEDAAVQMAMIYLDKDQVGQAAEATRRARKFGSSARLFTIEGRIAARQGDDAGAQELFRKAIQADADYPAAHLEHGLMYIRRKALSEGVRELNRYLELADRDQPGSRINEVELLLKQLEQAAGADGASS